MSTLSLSSSSYDPSALTLCIVVLITELIISRVLLHLFNRHVRMYLVYRWYRLQRERRRLRAKAEKFNSPQMFSKHAKLMRRVALVDKEIVETEGSMRHRVGQWATKVIQFFLKFMLTAIVVSKWRQVDVFHFPAEWCLHSSGPCVDNGGIGIKVLHFALMAKLLGRL